MTRIMTSEETRWARPSEKEGKSEAWNYFDIELPLKDRVKCKRCPNKIYKYAKSTRVMWYHLERVHHIKPSKQKQTEEQPGPRAGNSNSPGSVSGAAAESASSLVCVSSDEDGGTGDTDRAGTDATTDDGRNPKSPAVTQLSVAESWARDGDVAKFCVL